MTDNWTTEDERKFSELSVRRTLVLSKRREAVAFVVDELLGQAPELVDQLIANAPAVRDALAPYDSGVRLEARD